MKQEPRDVGILCVELDTQHPRRFELQGRCKRAAAAASRVQHRCVLIHEHAQQVLERRHRLLIDVEFFVHARVDVILVQLD